MLGLGFLSQAQTLWPLAVFKVQREALIGRCGDTQIEQEREGGNLSLCHKGECTSPTSPTLPSQSFRKCMNSEKLLHSPYPCTFTITTILSMLPKDWLFADLIKSMSPSSMGELLTSSVAYCKGQQTMAICFWDACRLRMDITFLSGSKNQKKSSL